MKRFCLLLAVFGLITATQLLAVPQPTKLVMVTEVWAPYRMHDKASPSGLSGIDIDLMAALELHLGIPIQIQSVPWARALEMIRSGKADLISGIALTADRSEYMKYVPTSYSTVRPMFFMKKGRAGTVKAMQI